MKLYLDHNSHALLVFKEGRVYVHAIEITSMVRVVKIDKSEMRYWREAEFKGQPYPLRRAVRKLRQAGKTLGITKAAAVALREVMRGTATQ